MSKTTSVMSAVCHAALSKAWMSDGVSTPRPSSCKASTICDCMLHEDGQGLLFSSCMGSGRFRVKRMFGRGSPGLIRMIIFVD